MKLFYKILIIFVSFLFVASSAVQSNFGVDGYIENKIDVTKNARSHSNMGNIYFSQHKYISALKEYEIAYNLTAQTNASAIYLYNIAKCYMAIGNYELAKKALLGVIHKDCMNITYYSELCECYFKLGEARKEIDNYLSKTENPYNRIVVGLLYLKLGEKNNAKMIFDDFINENPKLIITSDIKRILKKL